MEKGRRQSLGRVILKSEECRRPDVPPAVRCLSSTTTRGDGRGVGAVDAF
jgi:hypothetical protein